MATDVEAKEDDGRGPAADGPRFRVGGMLRSGRAVVHAAMHGEVIVRTYFPWEGAHYVH